MSITRAKKEEAVKDLKGVFKGAPMIVLTHCSGVAVTDLTRLRDQLAETGGTLRITKNRLARRALEGTPAQKALEPLFHGPTAIAWADDPVSTPKALTAFGKDHDGLKILGGVMDGKPLSAAEVGQLAALPSLDGLRARLIGLLTAPAARAAALIAAPAGQLARLIAAKPENKNTP